MREEKRVLGIRAAGGLSVVMMFWMIGASSVPQATPSRGFDYPDSPRVEQVDTLHGVQVADPYRWLEDQDSPQTREWIVSQNKLTFSYLETIDSRDEIRGRLEKLWDFEKVSSPEKRGGRYFFSRNDGLQNQSVLYTLKDLQGEPKVLLDPNQLSKDGTVALSGVQVSEDGNLLAYGISQAGSDWQEWKVRDVRTGQDLSDDLKWIKFSSASWTKDGRGFFYSRFDEPEESRKLAGTNYFHKLYYHRIGTPQSEDQLVYHRPDQKEWGFDGKVSDDGRHLVITVWKGTDTRNLVFFKDLSRPDSPVIEVISEFRARFDYLGNEGRTFWFLTDLDAPKGRILAIDLDRPSPDQWREVVPEAEQTLQAVQVLGNRFVASYLKDAHSELKVFSLEGGLIRQIALPGTVSVTDVTGQRRGSEIFYSITGFTTPFEIYRHDLEEGRSRLFRKPELLYNPGDYITRQVFYSSKDGTRVPMFITHKRGLRQNGKNPTLLYGYGGFNISVVPRFSVSNLVWMERGGVYAVPNLRGGGEYGEDWHQAGMRLKKQNVFDDFIAAAEWLIQNRYTSRDHLAITGRSNGGLLVGACLTQRPDLFGAAVPGVGVLDMLRFHKFTIGWAWVSDYGSPEVPEEFKALYSYSPYHNLKPGTRYPATLITTADHDDRVVPAHSFKFAAAMQQAQAGSDPVLIRIETSAGHGAGKPTSKMIEEAADILAFLGHHLGRE